MTVQSKTTVQTRTDSLENKDKKYIWHPFTQMHDWQQESTPIIERAEGVYLQDIHGKRYIDGVSSLWCNVHGHQVPELDRAVKEQLSRVSHTTFLGLSNPPAIVLAEKLIKILPKGLTRVFYSDSGSASVEIALKMAFQYWAQKGKPQKQKFVHLEESYHGDTLGSVSVGGIGLFHKIFGPLLFETISVETPHPYRWDSEATPEKVCEEVLEKVEQLFRETHNEIAAFMVEPLMQGAAGMIRHPEGFLRGLRKLTSKYDILLICDEVATGFGRTGRMFACEHEGVTPDLMCVAKGLTGGYLPLAATIATEEIYGAFLGRYEEFKAFFHGHTYTANPLACSAAIASIELFENNNFFQELAKKITFFQKWLESFRKLDHVGDIRQVGMMVGIELVRDKETKCSYSAQQKIGVRVIERAREKGVILRPLGSVIVLMPPLSISLEELKILVDVAFESIKEVTKE